MGQMRHLFSQYFDEDSSTFNINLLNLPVLDIFQIQDFLLITYVFL